jgi:hypothetical protein
MTADDWKRRSVCGTRTSVEVARGQSVPPATYLEVLGNLTDETLEGELADEKLCRLLVATNLAERDGSRAEAMGLLDTASRGLTKQKYVSAAGWLCSDDDNTYRRGCLASGLGGELLTRSLAWGKVIRMLITSK